MDWKAIFVTSWDHVAENPDSVPIAVIIEGLRNKDESIVSNACQAFLRRRNKGDVKPFVKSLLRDHRSYIRCLVIRALPEIGGPPSTLRYLMKAALKDRDSDVRILAFERTTEQLKEDGDTKRLEDFLVKVLKHNDSKIRCLATESLVELKDSKHYGYLLGKSLKDKSEDVRETAVEALLKRHDESLLNLLVKTLADESSQVRRAAITGLGEIGGSIAAKNLAISLEDANLLNQILATKFLEKLGWQPKTKAQKVCLKLAKEDWEGLEEFGAIAAEYICSRYIGHSEAQRALLNIGGPSVKFLCERLKVQDWTVRRDAAHLLAEIGDRQALKCLERLIRTEENEEVKFWVRKALEKMQAHT